MNTSDWLSFRTGSNDGWKERRHHGSRCWYRGSEGAAEAVLRLLAGESAPGSLEQRLRGTLLGHPGLGAGVAASAGTVVAWVDHIRSVPLFHASNRGRLLVSPDAHGLREEAALARPDELSALEFAMSGYATGPHTLYQDLHALQPGEALLWHRGEARPRSLRYHRYRSAPHDPVDATELLEQLDGLLDRAFRESISMTAGRSVWVPLSGGLDSRLVLCKLHQLGCPNLQTFSYGPRFNFEARRARAVAERLGVPWQFVGCARSTRRDWFESDARRAFWRYADGLKSVPCMREYAAVRALSERGHLAPESVFINGQSGDYITGGHLHSCWLQSDPDWTSLQDAIIDRHYDLWRSLKTPTNRRAIASRIDALIRAEYRAEDRGLDCLLAEDAWEYQGRQSCYTVNGQRVYEYFGHQWALPLWHRELVDFCAALAPETRFGQALFHRYLRRYDYQGLFPAGETRVWSWPAPMIWAPAVARCIRTIGGASADARFRAALRCFREHADQYACFPLALHRRTHANTRNVVSLFVRQWVREQPQLFTAPIRTALDLP